MAADVFGEVPDRLISARGFLAQGFEDDVVEIATQQFRIDGV